MIFNFFVCHKQIITYFCLVVKTKMNSSFFTYTLLNIASTTEITQNLVAIIVGEMAAGGLLVYSMLNLATFFSFSKKKFSLRATIISFPLSILLAFLTVKYSIFAIINPIVLVGFIIGSFFYAQKANEVIKKRKRIEEEGKAKVLKKAIDDLKNSNATKDRFFSIMAHDIKNPISSIKMLSELINENANELENKRLLELAKTLKTCVQSLFNLLENLLTWSRSQLGKIKCQPEKINVNEIILELKFSLYPVCDAKKINLNFDNGNIVEMYVDKNILQTILRNLITNAIKFSYENSSVEIKFSQDENFYSVSVSDNGTGMSQDTINQLFKTDKVISMPGTAHESGTGLGLIICNEFAAIHHGSIKVQSEEGLGSTFTVFLNRNIKN